MLEINIYIVYMSMKTGTSLRGDRVCVCVCVQVRACVPLVSFSDGGGGRGENARARNESKCIFGVQRKRARTLPAGENIRTANDFRVQCESHPLCFWRMRVVCRRELMWCVSVY